MFQVGLDCYSNSCKLGHCHRSQFLAAFYRGTSDSVLTVLLPAMGTTGFSDHKSLQEIIHQKMIRPLIHLQMHT